jgi:hypothetical protein
LNNLLWRIFFLPKEMFGKHTLKSILVISRERKDGKLAMWPALRYGLNNNKNLKELLNKIKEMMFCPGYKRVQRCSVLVAEGFNWVVGQQLLSPGGRTQHAIGSYTVKTQHPHGSCTRQDPEGCGSSTRQDPTWNGVLHYAGPEANWGPTPCKT